MNKEYIKILIDNQEVILELLDYKNVMYGENEKGEMIITGWKIIVKFSITEPFVIYNAEILEWPCQPKDLHV